METRELCLLILATLRERVYEGEKKKIWESFVIDLFVGGGECYWWEFMPGEFVFSDKEVIDFLLLFPG